MHKLCKKEQKMGFSRGFCHFLEFGDSDWLDISYDGSPKRFSTCGSGFRSCKINQLCKKWGFPGVSAIFSTLVTQIDSILHMMVVLNVSQHVAVVLGHAQLIDYVWCAWIVQKMAKNWGFPGVSAIFSTLVTQMDSISHMMVVLNVSQHVAVVIGHAWLINYAKCAKIVQKR